MTDPIPKLTSQLADVDPWLASIVDRALSNDPDQRFQRAEDMREALEEFIRASGDLVPDVQLSRVIRTVCGDLAARRDPALHERARERSTLPASSSWSPSARSR